MNWGKQRIKKRWNGPHSLRLFGFLSRLLLVYLLSPPISPHRTAPPSQTPPWERSDLPSLLRCLCFFYILNSPILPLLLNFAFALKLSPLSFPLNLLKPVSLSRASQVSMLVKNPPAMQEPQRRIQSLDWEGPLQRSMAPTVAFFPGGSPWTEEPGGLQSTGRKDSDTTEVT